MTAASVISAPVDYRPLDEINADLCDIRERLSALESAVYKPAHLEAVPTREERLDAAQAAIRDGVDHYIALGIIDADIITRIAHMLTIERIAVAEREGRL